MPILENYFKNKKDQNDFLIALVVILFFGLGIGYFLPSNQESTFFEITSSEEKVLPNSTETQKAEASLAPIVLHQSIQEKQSDWVNQLESKDVSNTPISTPIASDSSSLLITEEYPEVPITSAALLPATDTDTDSLDQDIPNLTTTIEETKDSSLQSNNEKAFISTEEFITDSLKATESLSNKLVDSTNYAVPKQKTIVSPLSDSCAIFLGAFKAELNAQQLVDRIQKEQKYTTFTNYERGYQVVGIKVSCNQAQANRILKEVRKKYSKEAWFAPIKE